MKVVIGLGITGLSCIDYLVSQGESVIAMDAAHQPARYQAFKEKHPDLPCVVGHLDPDILKKAHEIILSPGVSPIQAPLLACQQQGIPLISDIDLLARATQKPIYAITGSNGKTSVTTLLGEMAKAAGRSVAVAGNIGIPVLQSLNNDDQLDAYILELSSFQLDITHDLLPRCSVILKLSPDHLDRYANLDAYRQAKQRIYRRCQHPIVNQDEPELWQNLPLAGKPLTFSIKQTADYGLQYSNNQRCLSINGKAVLATSEMRLQGPHHWQNALVALAMGNVMQLPLSIMLDVLRDFSGLPHRCQWVREHRGVNWYNDSKGTNIGATETAINSVAESTRGRLILLAGGQGKDADFTQLRTCLKRHVSEVLLFGQDADLMSRAWHHVTTVTVLPSLDSAVELANQRASAGDVVLLSPACASFDEFKGFEDRGQQFMNQVNAL